MATSAPNDDEIVDDYTEDEDVEKDVVYSVNSFGADFLIDGLIKRLRDGDIFRPEFQRDFVWTLPQASKFIESILLGLPIPGIFLYREEETRKHLIIDGLQRLTTIEAFSGSRLPHSDKVFRLEKISSRFGGKYIDDLDDEDRRRFFDTAIHATIIQQMSPENDQSSIYYIFERLNTGGTPLQPQEIRAALYHGPFQDFLQQLNENKTWRGIFGPKHKRAKDLEMILRFLAFRYDRKTYKSPMKSFLNSFMAKNRYLKKRSKSEMSSDFDDTLSFIVSSVPGRLFRPVRSFNAAAFDSIMAVVSENLSSISPRGAADFAQRYDQLMRDTDFLRLITRSTADDQSVKDRFEKVEELLVN